MLNYNYIEEHSHIYGPDVRAVIWFQGCSILCKGCWNQDMLSFEARHTISPNDLAIKIKAIQGIQGITILGGEPLNQDLDSLIEFLSIIKKSGLSIVLFTGYRKEDVPQNIINLIDILIANPYIENLRTTSHYLIGSTNQEIYYISDAYKEENMLENANYQEVIIDEDGTEHWLGFPENIKNN